VRFLSRLVLNPATETLYRAPMWLDIDTQVTNYIVTRFRVVFLVGPPRALITTVQISNYDSSRSIGGGALDWVRPGVMYEWLVAEVGRASILRQQNVLMSPAGLRPEKDSAGEAQQQLKITDPTSRQRGRFTSTNP
jgi:hypothetical protein